MCREVSSDGCVKSRLRLLRMDLTAICCSPVLSPRLRARHSGPAPARLAHPARPTSTPDPPNRRSVEPPNRRADFPCSRSVAWKHLEEFLGTLFLEAHPHNFSEVLKKESSAAAPRLVREAEYLMRTGGASITVSEVAKSLRVSLRSLELGFRDARKMTPTQAHCQIRLNAARETLLNRTASTSVTSVAISCGFPYLARFSSHYQLAFGWITEPDTRRCRGGSA